MVTVRTESIDKIRKLGIGDDKKNPKILKTVWTAGYRLNKWEDCNGSDKSELLRGIALCGSYMR